MAGNFPGTPANPVKVQTTLFDRVLASTQYWVGITNHSGEITIPTFERAAGELLADTYINEQQIYPPSSIGMFTGEEQDPALLSADRFVVLRRHATEGWAELFATAANAQRGSKFSGRLPIEEAFKELFPDPNETVGSVEISRLASRYPSDKSVHHAGFICLMRTSFAQALEMDAPYVYAHTEQFVLDSIEEYGLPMEVLGSIKSIREARKSATQLVPVRFDVNEVNRMRVAGHPIIEYYLRGLEYHNGLGFFDGDLMPTTDPDYIVEPVYQEPLYPDL